MLTAEQLLHVKVLSALKMMESLFSKTGQWRHRAPACQISEFSGGGRRSRMAYALRAPPPGFGPDRLRPTPKPGVGGRRASGLETNPSSPGAVPLLLHIGGARARGTPMEAAGAGGLRFAYAPLRFPAPLSRALRA